jgi:hypothetical protein
VARYIYSDEQDVRMVHFHFIWRATAMPTEGEIASMLQDLRTALLGVLDWETARYTTCRMWMHT